MGVAAGLTSYRARVGSRPASGIFVHTKHTACAFRWVGPPSAPNVSPIEQPVIAVLPFENLSAEPDSDYFVDGLTERNHPEPRGRRRTGGAVADLIVRLQGQAAQPPRCRRAARRKPGCEGSVLRSGTSCVSTRNWSGSRTRCHSGPSGSIASVERRVCHPGRDFAGDRQQASIDVGRGQRRYDIDPEAYELYLKGRALVGRRGIPGLEKAVGSSNRSSPRIRRSPRRMQGWPTPTR